MQNIKTAKKTKRRGRKPAGKKARRKIIFVQETGGDSRANIIGLNKNYDEWADRDVNNSQGYALPPARGYAGQSAHI